MDVRDLGERFKPIIARMTWESRGNVTIDEAPTNTIYRFHTADSDYKWPTSVGLIESFGELEERGRSAESIRTRYRALYERDQSQGSVVDQAAYRGVVRAGIDGSTVTRPTLLQLHQAEARWGRRDLETLVFVTVRDANTANDVLGYYASESIRRSREWSLRQVPWDQAYTLQRGDIVELTQIPWATGEQWLARVLGIARNPDTGTADLLLLMTSPASFSTDLLGTATIDASLSVATFERLRADLSASGTITADLIDTAVVLSTTLSGVATIDAQLALFGPFPLPPVTLAGTSFIDATLFLPGPALLSTSGTLSGTATLDADMSISGTGPQHLFATLSGTAVITGTRLLFFGDIPISGTLTASGVVTATLIDAGDVFSPEDLSGLVLWLDADDAATVSDDGGGECDQWNDKSASGINFTQTTDNRRPIIKSGGMNGRTTLDCETIAGTFRWMEGTDTELHSDANGLTIFYVTKINTVSTNRKLITKRQSANDGAFTFESGSTLVDGSTDASVGYVGVTSAQLLVSVWEPGTKLETWRDGVSLGSDTSSVPSSLNDGTHTLTIGTDPSKAFAMRGEVGEIVVYNRALSDEDRNQVEEYLQARWGTPALP